METLLRYGLRSAESFPNCRCFSPNAWYFYSRTWAANLELPSLFGDKGQLLVLLVSCVLIKLGEAVGNRIASN